MMEEKKDKQSLIKKYFWLFLIGVIGAGVAIYFLAASGKMSKVFKFTKYEKLDEDGLVLSEDTLRGLTHFNPIKWDTLGGVNEVQDSLYIFPTDSVLLDSTLTAGLLPDDPIIMEEPVPKPIKISEEGTSTPSDTLTEIPTTDPLISPKGVNDLLDELIAKSEQSNTAKARYADFYQQEILSAKTLLKLVAINGRNLLEGEYPEYAKEMLTTLVEEAEVLGILIVDRNNTIVYSTNSKFIHQNITQAIPGLDLQPAVPDWSFHTDQIITVLPLYQTLGRIGTAILITNGSRVKKERE